MELRELIVGVAIAVVVLLVLAAVVLYLAYRRLRRIRIAADADFLTTVRAVPLTLVIGLDLLDLALDVFSTPLTWLLLDRLGLKSLRNVATIKAMIPLGDAIPLLTLSWFVVRLLRPALPPDPNVIETERVGPGRFTARPPRR